MPAFLGIDVAKDTLVLGLLGPKTPRKTSLPNTPAGYARVSARITGAAHCVAVAEYLEALEGRG